tara:strand:+ start:15780 stop:16031 length:252 start_codon:yes stop_codon:yes gene_type:complete
MTDTEMEVILDMIDDIFQDQIKEGHHPITIASVVFAVAIKHLKLNLDKEDFIAIIDEIRNTDVDELIEIRYVDSNETKKRTIH